MERTIVGVPGGVWLIVLLGALLRMWQVDEQPLWLDEAFSLWMAQRSPGEMMAWLVRIDHHPPLYYLVLSGWIGLFGDSERALRSLSVLCSTLAIVPGYGFARRLIGRWGGLLVALIMAVSPFQVRYAQEARMYALLMLAAAVVMACTTRILEDEPEGRSVGRGWWAALAIAQAAAMLAHNTATVLLPFALNVGVLVPLLWRRDQGAGRFVRRWLAWQGVAVLLWSPWAWQFVIQSRVVDERFWIWPPTWAMIWETYHGFNFAYLGRPFPLFPVWDWLYWGLALVGVAGIAQTSRASRAWLIVSLFAMPPLVELAVSLRRPIFFAHTLLWTMLPYFVLVAAGMVLLGKWVGQLPALPRWRFGAALGGALAVIFLLLNLVGLGSYYVAFEKEEWDKAAQFVAQQVQPGDVILIHASWVELPFGYYWRRYGAAGEVHGLPVDLFDAGELEPVMNEAALPRLHQLIDGKARVWLVYSHEWYTDPERILLHELSESLVLVQETQFLGIQVLQFVRE